VREPLRAQLSGRADTTAEGSERLDYAERQIVRSLGS